MLCSTEIRNECWYCMSYSCPIDLVLIFQTCSYVSIKRHSQKNVSEHLISSIFTPPLSNLSSPSNPDVPSLSFGPQPMQPLGVAIPNCPRTGWNIAISCKPLLTKLGDKQLKKTWIAMTPSGNQTWQWECPVNEGFNGKTMENHL